MSINRQDKSNTNVTFYLTLVLSERNPAQLIIKYENHVSFPFNFELEYRIEYSCWCKGYLVQTHILISRWYSRYQLQDFRLNDLVIGKILILLWFVCSFWFSFSFRLSSYNGFDIWFYSYMPLLKPLQNKCLVFVLTLATEY